MKNIILAIILGFVTFSSVNAQTAPTPLKGLVIDALVEYGIRLYERNDKNQAKAVFMKALSYDQNQQTALKYLNLIDPKQVRVFAPVKQVKVPAACPMPKQAESLSIEELRKRIAQKEQSITALKSELEQVKSKSDQTVNSTSQLQDPAAFNAYLEQLRLELKSLRQDVNAKRDAVDAIEQQIKN